MTCDCIESGKPLEGTTGHTASCNYARRRAEKQALKPVKAPKPISKVGKNNTFECSDGTRVTQAQINKLLSKSHVEIFTSHLFGGIQLPRECAGCGTRCESVAHIIAKSRCKTLNKTELIWSLDNQFPACFSCNAAIENPKGHAWKFLKNAQKCLDFIQIHDTELYQKFMVNSAGFNDKHAI
jgi:5-methylcytosine-specific restriction endonuclease McrA